MKKKIFSILLIMVACAAVVSAQNRKALRINEIMVQNDSSVVDDYGCRSAWIELFNSNFAPLEISSVYLTNNKEVLNIQDPQERKKMMYSVPLGDVNTKIPKRQHVVFWADDQPTRGTFHTNFTLKAGEENWIAVIDANGIDIIDSVTVPANLAPNTTFARKEDGVFNEKNPELTWMVRDNLTDTTYITPSSNNIIKDSNSKVERFATDDPHGFSMTVMAMAIVFCALLLLCISFYIISKIGARISKGNKAKSQGTKLRDLAKEDRPEHDSGEEIAAIVMALHEHLDAHDQENTVLTINKVKRAYSPWSSKIYGLREVPRR
ncbi:MAG: OadG family protein [Bacteroides sp.]|nr:OadG family protein [Bacteroides sp.]MCM1413196.1 OadG family protein [Bacteroides sp.]MCM1472062.1 OadG family protein [Bacteroides sp.]